MLQSAINYEGQRAPSNGSRSSPEESLETNDLKVRMRRISFRVHVRKNNYRFRRKKGKQKEGREEKERHDKRWNDEMVPAAVAGNQRISLDRAHWKINGIPRAFSCLPVHQWRETACVHRISILIRMHPSASIPETCPKRSRILLAVTLSFFLSVSRLQFAVCNSFLRQLHGW